MPQIRNNRQLNQNIPPANRLQSLQFLFTTHLPVRLEGMHLFNVRAASNERSDFQ